MFDRIAAVFLSSFPTELTSQPVVLLVCVGVSLSVSGARAPVQHISEAPTHFTHVILMDGRCDYEIYIFFFVTATSPYFDIPLHSVICFTVTRQRLAL